jgi:hypothetical protein
MKLVVEQARLEFSARRRRGEGVLELGGEMTSSQGMTLTVDTREPWPHPWERYLSAGWSMERGRVGDRGRRAGGIAALRADCLFAEVDVFDEHDLAVIVFDDVVAVEPIAVLIEIVGALGADVALDAQDRLANLLRLKALSVVDRER